MIHDIVEGFDPTGLYLVAEIKCISTALVMPIIAAECIVELNSEGLRTTTVRYTNGELSSEEIVNVSRRAVILSPGVYKVYVFNNPDMQFYIPQSNLTRLFVTDDPKLVDASVEGQIVHVCEIQTEDGSSEQNNCVLPATTREHGIGQDMVDRPALSDSETSSGDVNRGQN